MLASTGALALVLVGCGSSNTASSSSDSSTDSSTSATTETAAPAQSNYAVTIDGATAGTDYKGNPCIIVTYTFTNNSDDATSFALAYNAEVYQNGVQCETAICQSIDSSSYMPGPTWEPMVGPMAGLSTRSSGSSSRSVEEI